MGEIKKQPVNFDAKEKQDDGVLSREEVDGLVIEVDESEPGKYKDGSQEVELDG